MRLALGFGNIWPLTQGCSGPSPSSRQNVLLGSLSVIESVVGVGSVWMAGPRSFNSFARWYAKVVGRVREVATTCHLIQFHGPSSCYLALGAVRIEKKNFNFTYNVPRPSNCDLTQNGDGYVRVATRITPTLSLKPKTGVTLDTNCSTRAGSVDT